MKRLQKVSLLLSLIEELRNNGSWCGETHIQKAVFFLENITKISLDFEFILYKHGPFSFDLREELTAMRADNLCEIQFQPPPYGPSFFPTESGNELKEHFPKTIDKYFKKIKFISKFFGDKGVEELERISTALFVYNRYPRKEMFENAKYINDIKSHISLPEAESAIKEVKELITKVENKFK